MRWREHLWEGFVAALSWIVALVVLACVAVFVAVDAGKRRRSLRAAPRAIDRQAVAASSLKMELAS